MTFEELREEAHRQGYHLIKYNPLPKIQQCTCGRKKYFKRLYHTAWGCESVSIYCPDCGREVEGGSEREAREIWNGGALNGKDDQSSEKTT